MYLQHHYKEYKGVSLEQPWRIEAILDYVDAEVVPLNEGEAIQAITKVHGRSYFERFAQMTKAEKGKEPDGLYKVALNAVNTAIKAAKENTFAIIRPPGHHAGWQMEGFCYFNNVVIAANELGKRTAIIDIDAHYGNGTHYLVRNNPNYFYASMHTKFLYPPERYSSENAVLMEVVPAEITDEAFLEGWKQLLEKVKAWEPEVLAISAGFDTWFDDPIAGFNVRHYKTYYELGKMLRELDIPMFAVLEGGYHKKLGRMVEFFTKGTGMYKQDPEIVTEVMQFERDPEKRYALTEDGQLISFKTNIDVVGRIYKKPGYSYEILRDKIVQRKIYWLEPEEYDQLKKENKLQRLYRKGYDVRIRTDNLTLQEARKIEDNIIKNALEGKFIDRVEVQNTDRERVIILYLDNGKRFIFREGKWGGTSRVEWDD